MILTFVFSLKLALTLPCSKIVFLGHQALYDASDVLAHSTVQYYSILSVKLTKAEIPQDQ